MNLFDHLFRAGGEWLMKWLQRATREDTPGALAPAGGGSVAPSNLFAGQTTGPALQAAPRSGLDPAAGEDDLPQTILLVDDEPMVLRSIHRILTANGYRVLKAECGKDAIQLFRQLEEDVDLLLVDISMPDMNGFDVIRALHELDPGLPHVLMSGYGNEEAKENEGLEEHHHFLRKPFRMKELLAAVNRALTRQA